MVHAEPAPNQSPPPLKPAASAHKTAHKQQAHEDEDEDGEHQSSDDDEDFSSGSDGDDVEITLG